MKTGKTTRILTLRTLQWEKIPASETENVGGFVNDKVNNTDSFFSFINYSYDSENPAQINKFPYSYQDGNRKYNER